MNSAKEIFAGLSPNARKILSSVTWLLSERLLRMAISFLMTAWIARYLGADYFGALNYAMAFCSIFTVLAQLGLNQIVVRDLVLEPERKSEILGTAFAMKLLAGGLAMVLSLGCMYALRPGDTTSLALVGMLSASLLAQEFYVIEFWFQSQVHTRQAVWSRNTGFMAMTLVRLWLIARGAGLLAFALSYTLETVIVAMALVGFYRRDGEAIRRWRLSLGRAKRLLKVSWPLVLSSLAILIYLRIDQVMLGQLANNAAVGHYSVAVRLSEALPFMAALSVKSFAPAIIESKKRSLQAYRHKLQIACSFLTLVAYAVALPLSVLSGWVVTTLFGAEYASAGPVLAVHIWSSVFVFMGYVKQIWITNEELTGFAFFAGCLGAVFNVGLNWWLIPIYGGLGAAIATIISYAFADYVSCFIYPPARQFGQIMTSAFLLKGVGESLQVVTRR
ncbi:MAG: flippase [Cyanobacteria bacterium P01_A01_bin.105]